MLAMLIIVLCGIGEVGDDMEIQHARKGFKKAIALSTGMAAVLMSR